MNLFSRSSVFVTLGCILLALAAPAAPGQSKQVSTRDLAERAEVVALGKVTQLKSEWDESRSRIRTVVTLSVDEYVKGAGNGTLVIVTPGGEVDGVGELYSHMPAFRQSEEVLVFAERDRAGRLRVAAGKEGKYTVTRDASTGQKSVSDRPLEDVKNLIRSAASPGQRN